MSNPDGPTSRRQFLIAVGAGGAATAAAVVAAVAPEPAVTEPDGTKPVDKGYQVSEHINKYYRTTRV